VTELLSSTNDPSQIKLPTPSQVADTLFKHISAKKQEGFTQANQNTVVQQSAILETASKRGDSSAESAAQLQSQLRSPDKTTRDQAARELLKQKLGWN
jgi:predicted negative regulator of RcsB-dependent stress response